MTTPEPAKLSPDEDRRRFEQAMADEQALRDAARERLGIPPGAILPDEAESVWHPPE